MGDLARTLLYPLILPFIVAAVWAYAWVMRAERAHAADFLPSAQAVENFSTIHPPQFPPVQQYGLVWGDDAFVAVDDAE
jgi:hypothetical protein